MKFQKKILANGLTVLFEKRDVDVTTVMLGVRYGSAYETIEEKGIAHFIEHLCFKGTEKRDVRQIANEVEKIGGVLNAFTAEEVTAYHVKLPSKHLDVAMDVIFDVFFNPIFPEKDVEREASVICEEIKMYRDNPMRHTLEKIKENLYEEPFGSFAAGKQAVVKAMTREQLMKRHNEAYVPGNSILCVVGNNDFDEVVAMAEKLSGEEKDGMKFEIPEVKLKNVQDEEKRNGLEQANVALGFHFPKANDKNNYAADIFTTILGGGMSSKLFMEVREKRGLVYGVKSDLDVGKHYGYMIIWAGTDPSNVEEVKKICLEEVKKMEDITEQELSEAKVQVIGDRQVESEGCGDTAVNLMMEEITGDAKDYYDYEAKINEVSLEDVKKLANNAEFSSFSLGP